MGRANCSAVSGFYHMKSLVFVVLLLAPLAGPCQSTLSSPFDHFTTGFRLDGAHRLATCESCHADGMFVGTPTRCAGCHAQPNRVRASTKPAQHALTSESCESCHRTDSWVPIARMDHLEVIGTCASCHNGQRGTGKPVTHIPASNTCEDCHSTMIWSPVRRVDHMQVLGTCSSCHNGVIAMGQHPQHIPTTAECDTCHNTMAWRP